MQDIKAVGGVGGGGGSLFGVDRRLRALNQQQHQPLKCPRCQSLNTKFCYYNNYNLSQPRHFCKGCRRYWTKGGVLRNVPVGGGCRKPNKPKQPSLSSHAAAKIISHSSSQSSSLTATTAAAVAGEVVSGGCRTSSNSAVPPPPPESSFFASEAVPSNLNFNPSSVDGGSIFPEMGTFTGLMTASGFNMGDIWKYGLDSENEGNHNQEMQQQYVDDQIEYSGNRISDGGVAAVAWQAAGGEDDDHRNQQHGEDEGMFDLTGRDVDQAYWSQQITHCPDYHHHHSHNHNHNHNHSLHFLP